ncbi:MAG: DNA cytosine methyltransferase, partial [Oscillospiraceae bacterium]|nr:DNA cytosine methyltransferase [Oscillospiraceae bacterium]
MDSGHFPAVMAAEPVNVTVSGKAQCLRASYYKDGIRNMVGNSIDRKTCVAEPVRIEMIENDTQDSVETAAGRHTTPIRVGTMPNTNGSLNNSQSKRVYDIDGKSVPLQARPNGGGADGAATGLYAMPALIDDYSFFPGETTGTGDVEFIGGFAKKDGTKWLEDGKAFSRNFNQGKRLHGINGKSVTVTAQGAGLAGHAGLYAVPLNCGSSDCRDKFYSVYEVRDGQLTIKDRQYPIKLNDGFYIIRKLTVCECKRLQTVPEDFVFPVSNTQAYKMLGNGWTCDVISHILSYCPNIASEPLTVLSMYDGMSCGRIALNKLGAHIAAYYAAEIDKYAVKTSQTNFPDIIHLGDAFQVRKENWK